MRQNFYLSILFILLYSVVGNAQTVFFTENMGTPGATTSIAANTFQNGSPIVFTGTGDVRTSNPSITYAGSSGGGNVFLTNTGSKDFLISGIDSSTYSAISLTFGLNKSATASNGSELSVEVSSDGITFTPLVFSVSSGSGTAAASWQLATPTGTIPSTSNLRLRFTNTSSSPQFRIDDVKLSGNAAPIFTTAMNGAWNVPATWVQNAVPTSADNVRILNAVSVTAPETRNAGSTTYVAAGAVLAVNVNYTENGTLTADGTFKINNGGSVNGSGSYLYGTNGALEFETMAIYNTLNTDIYWPAAAANAPKIVRVRNGGLQMGAGMNRTVEIAFSTASYSAPVAGIRFAPNALKLNGTVTINAGGFFANKPIYGPASTLIYSTGGVYGRGFEWDAISGIIGTTPGYPSKVSIMGATTLDYNNGGTPGPKAMDSDLNIAMGSTFDMGFGGGNSGGALTVNGNLVNNGTFRLGNQNSVDDFRLGGNLTNTGTFDAKSRTTFFTKAGTQIITSLAGITIPYISLTSGSTNVQLSPGTNVNVAAPTTGIAINFSAAGDNIDINGNTLSIGTAAVSNTIVGMGTFSGSATSNLTLLGTGDVGIIKFAAGKQSLKDLTLNRTLPPATQSVLTLASPLTIATTLNLTNGILDLGNNLLTLERAVVINGASAANYIIADAGYGTTAGVKKLIGAGGTYIFPIGDRYASADLSQYSPVTVEGTGGSYTTLAFVQASVTDLKHPNLDAATDFITRYWSISTGGVSGPVTNFRATGTYTLADVNTPANEAGYLGNRWDGTSWSNGGMPVNAGLHNTSTVPCVIGQTNEITAGVRNPNINVRVAAVNYLNNSTYNFGTVVTGSTNPVTFTVENLGQGAVNVLNTIFAGNPPFIYSPTLPTGGIVNGTPKTFTVSFNPTVAGPITGSITILNNSSDATETSYKINFTGNAVLPTPNMNVKANGPVFANVPNGQAAGSGLNNTQWAPALVGSATPKALKIENLGTATLLLTGVPKITVGGVNPSDFIITLQPAGSILPSSSSDFTISFNPTAPGTRSAIISIANNDVTKNPYTFYVEGTGDGSEMDIYGNGIEIVDGTAVASTANGTDFGNVDFSGGSSTSRIFTVSNIGNANLTLSNPVFTPATTEFTVTTLPSVLAPDSEVSFTVTFSPTSAGLKTATISIANNDFNENPYTFVVQGNGDFSTCSGLALPVDIASQNFEGTANPINWPFVISSDPGATVPITVGGTNYGLNRTTKSNMFIGAKSLQARGYSNVANTNKESAVEFGVIDASLYQDLTLNFQLGAYSRTTGQGLDVGDFATVLISTNGGASYTKEMQMAGFSNAIWSVVTGSGTATSNYDGNNVAVPYGFTAATNTNNLGPKNITLTNLPNSSQLRVKIVFALDLDDEIWVIDDVKLSGKKEGISTWNGTAWIPSAPTSTTKAIIDGDYTTSAVNGNVSACSITINPNKTVTIVEPYYFDIQNDIVNNGSMVVESSGSIVQHNDASINTGSNFTIKRTTTPFARFDYTYWSSPVATSTIGSVFATWRTDYAFQFVTANFSDMVTAATGAAPPDGFDDAAPSPWVNASLTLPMQPARGYAIMGPTTGMFPRTDTPVFMGKINNGPQTYTLGLSGNAANTNDDFNLVGNPYPSAISANLFINANLPNISGTLYFWTHKGDISAANPGPNMQNFVSSDYAMYNLSGGTATSTATTTVGGSACGTCGNAPTGNIASGQGFLVEAQSTNNIVFNNTMRLKSSANNNFYRNSNDQTESPKNRFWLDMSNPDGFFSQQLIAYFDETTLGYDPGYDGIVNNNRPRLSFYSLATDLKMRIQARPRFETSDIVPLGYASAVNGQFTISLGEKEGVFANAETFIYLHDNLLNIDHNLKQSPYTFTNSYGVYDDRFEIRYANALLSTDQSIKVSGDVGVTVNNKQIEILSTIEDLDSVEIYDITGKRIFSQRNIASKNLKVQKGEIADQALIVKITLANGATVNKKIIVK